MASEPLKIRLYSEGDFDGITPMSYARADFQVRGQRYYEKIDIAGPVGQIGGDFFGLFADTTPKMVGIASSGEVRDPSGRERCVREAARVLSDDPKAPPLRLRRVTQAERDVLPLAQLAVRYSGIGNDDARLYIVDGHLREAGVVQSDLKNVIWSRVQFVSHDDLVGLWTPAPAGGTVVCDIELVRVQPGDRLRGRYSVQA